MRVLIYWFYSLLIGRITHTLFRDRATHERMHELEGLNIHFYNPEEFINLIDIYNINT